MKRRVEKHPESLFKSDSWSRPHVDDMKFINALPLDTSLTMNLTTDVKAVSVFFIRVSQKRK